MTQFPKKVDHASPLRGKRCRALDISAYHIFENLFPPTIAGGLDKIVAIDHQFFIAPEMSRILQNLKKAIEFLVVLKEVSGEHVMPRRHRAFVVFVSLSIGSRLCPRKAVRVVEKSDHAMHEVIGSRNLVVGSLH